MSSTLLMFIGMGVGYAAARLHNRGWYKAGNYLLGGFVLIIVIWFLTTLFTLTRAIR